MKVSEKKKRRHIWKSRTRILFAVPGGGMTRKKNCLQRYFIFNNVLSKSLHVHFFPLF